MQIGQNLPFILNNNTGKTNAYQSTTIECLSIALAENWGCWFKNLFSHNFLAQNTKNIPVFFLCEGGGGSNSFFSLKIFWLLHLKKVIFQTQKKRNDRGRDRTHTL